jgi:alanine-glyoxylate transaminase/(R)-3-amino-2-methylpropionate-pyruvate transaminase
LVSLQLNIVEGKKQYLYDEHGRRFLDAFAGIATVCCGHSHPDIIDAITAQARRLQHSTVLYLNHAIADFAEALAAKMPGDLKARTCQIKQLHETFARSLPDGV